MEVQPPSIFPLVFLIDPADQTLAPFVRAHGSRVDARGDFHDRWRSFVIAIEKEINGSRPEAGINPSWSATGARMKLQRRVPLGKNCRPIMRRLFRPRPHRELGVNLGDYTRTRRIHIFFDPDPRHTPPPSPRCAASPITPPPHVRKIPHGREMKRWRGFPIIGAHRGQRTASDRFRGMGALRGGYDCAPIASGLGTGSSSRPVRPHASPARLLPRGG